MIWIQIPMKQIETEVLINANPERVWQVLTDFESHSRWNPFIQSIKGEKSVGKKLTVTLKPSDGNGMTFKPRILTFEPGKEFRWKGKLGVKGIFDGEHYFILEEKSENQTRFIHGEKFSGILVAFLERVLNKTKVGFNLMNDSIKRECEKVN